MEFTLEKSLQSDIKHSGGRGSAGDSSEAPPILLNHQPETVGSLLPSNREFILDIHRGDSSPGVKDSDFIQRSHNEMTEDSPSKPTVQFLPKQKTSGHNVRDMDSERELHDLERNSPFLWFKAKFRLMVPPMFDRKKDPLFDKDLCDEHGRENVGVFTMFQWVSLVVMMVALICTLFSSDLRKVNLWKMELWKLELIILVLICGELISGWGFQMVVYFIAMNFFLSKWVLYFVYGIRKQVQIFLWLVLVLAVWLLLFDKGLEAETEGKALRYVTKILVYLLVGFLTWSTKTLMVNVLTSFFHVRTYFDRLKESLINKLVIETHSKPPRIEIEKSEEDEEKLVDKGRQFQRAGETIPGDLQNNAFSTSKEGRVIGSEGRPRGPSMRRKSMKLFCSIKKKEDDRVITINDLLKLSTKNVCAWNVKRMMNIVRQGIISSCDDPNLGDTSRHEDYYTIQTRIKKEGKAAARKIFQKLVISSETNKSDIRLEDLMRFMGEDEAKHLFNGASDSNIISESSLENWVVNAFRERSALALTLNDIAEVVDKLHVTVNIIIFIMLILVSLLILELATATFFLLVGSLVALAAAIIGNTGKAVFEAIIFLFVIHPFDVGDWCQIDGVQMTVEKMNILTTIFRTYDHQQIITQNCVLSTKSIHNFNRSPHMIDTVEFCVHKSTPPEKTAAIRERISKYVDGKKEHWCPNPTIVYIGFEGLNMMRYEVRLTPRMSHQDMDERMARRGSFVEEIVKILQDLDIQDSFFTCLH